MELKELLKKRIELTRKIREAAERKYKHGDLILYKHGNMKNYAQFRVSHLRPFGSDVEIVGHTVHTGNLRIIPYSSVHPEYQ